MRSITAAMCTAAGLLMPVAAWAQISEHTIKFAFLNSADHPQGLGASKFAELVKQQSGGKISVKLFPGGALGGDLQTIAALQEGTIEMTVLNAGLLASQVKAFAAMDMPFLFSSSKEAFAVMDSDFAKRLLNRLADKNLIGLGYWDLGFRHVTNSKKPITRLEDFSGMRLRVLQLPTYINLFNALGATAVPMPFTGLYSALESHAVDGQDNPVTVIYNARFFEVQKYLSLTRHTYNPQVLLVSKKFWSELSPTEQKLLTSAATEATTYQRKVSLDREAAALDALKKAGMQVNEPSLAEMARIRDKAKPAVEMASQSIGESVLADMNSAIATARKSN